MKNRSIYAAMKQGVLLCDERARIIYFNECFSRFTGRKLKEVKGHYLTEIKPDAIGPQVIETGEGIEGHYYSYNGRDYLVDINPVIEDGRTVGSVTILTFIENTKLVKEKLIQIDREQQMLSARLSRINGTNVAFRDMVYSGKALEQTVSQAKAAARESSPVLVTGESGVGKNIFAQAIHNASSRREGPFVAINCATLDKLTLESELFGFEEGAFSGLASDGKAGLFEIASGGTLFLDEISELDDDLQEKLIRVLKEGKMRRMGSLHDVVLDVRIIAASNVDLDAYAQEHLFREELYHLLSEVRLQIPPLRERPEDILPLVDYFLKMNRIKHKREYTMDPEIRDIFLKYPWPDNVREVKNIVACLTASADDGHITRFMLPQHILDVASASEGGYQTLSSRVREYEREEIRKMIRCFGENTEGKRKAAKALGISLATLYNKLG